MLLIDFVKFQKGYIIMIYKDYKGLKLSALGFGSMRLPTINGVSADIDKDHTAQMVAYAMEKGVNYYDTAWGYHDGNSELVMGEILEKYPRDSFYLATKFPGYDLSNMPKVKDIFAKQLEKCRVDYFDFYLIHNVCEANIDGYLNPEHGILPYLLQMKEEGKIRHLGFSVHGTYETMMRFMEMYGDYMEFCQIQLNWMDWDLQEAKLKVKYLNEKNIPIWVMEPIRGGKLANLPQEYMEKLEEKRPGVSAVEWDFRYLQSIPGVTVVLSGMSESDHVKDNISIFETEKPATEEETALLYEIGKAMSGTVPCTACRYCTAHCPMELDIPRLINMYNDFVFSGGGFAVKMAVDSMPEDKRPSACIGCGNCVTLCPQSINIPEILADFAEKLK